MWMPTKTNRLVLVKFAGWRNDRGCGFFRVASGTTDAAGDMRLRSVLAAAKPLTDIHFAGACTEHKFIQSQSISVIFARDRNMEEMVLKQLETSPMLERKRAKYTVEDVRQLCGGISRSTVMREIRRKRLACYRARRTLRFSEEHITNYLERVEQGGNERPTKTPGRPTY
jgi:hypothetical protein